MSLQDHRWISLDGSPVTGKVPTRLVVRSDPPGLAPNGQQIAFASQAYRRFANAVANTVFPLGVHRNTESLADGSVVVMHSIQGVHTVELFIRSSSRKKIVVGDIIYVAWQSRQTKTPFPRPGYRYYGRSGGVLTGTPLVGTPTTGPDGYFRSSDNLFLGPVIATGVGGGAIYTGLHNEYEWTFGPEGFESPVSGFLQPYTFVGSGDFFINWEYLDALSLATIAKGTVNVSALPRPEGFVGMQAITRNQTALFFHDTTPDSISGDLIRDGKTLGLITTLQAIGSKLAPLYSPTENISQDNVVLHYDRTNMFTRTVDYQNRPSDAFSGLAFTHRIWKIPALGQAPIEEAQWLEIYGDVRYIRSSKSYVFAQGFSGFFGEPGLPGGTFFIDRLTPNMEFIARHRFTPAPSFVDNMDGGETMITGRGECADDDFFGSANNRPGQIGAYFSMWFTPPGAPLPTVYAPCDVTFPIARQDNAGIAKYYDSLFTAAANQRLFVVSESSYLVPAAAPPYVRGNDAKLLLHVYSAAPDSAGQLLKVLRLGNPDHFVDDFFKAEINVERAAT